MQTWPLREPIAAPLATFQSPMVLSALPEARVVLSGLNAMSITASRCISSEGRTAWRVR